VGTDFTALLRKAQQGDAEALRELHARYESRVLAVVHRRLAPALRSRCDTADVAQSVFEDVLRDLPKFEDRGEEAFRHWLYLKAENKIRDAWRRRCRPDGGPREAPLETSDGDRVAGRRRGPATQAGDADDVARLRAVVATLSSGQREILSLRDDEGLAFGQIAERLGLAGADAARMRYARVLVTIRERWSAR